MSSGAKRWYVIHAYSGFEKMVLRTLTERIALSPFSDQFGKIMLPTEEVMDVKNGKKTISERKFFPGYLFIEMEMNEQTWHLVTSTPKVTSFIGGSGNKPHPLPQKEVDIIMARMEEGNEKPKPKIIFEVGQSVRVTEGPFADFNGTVEEISYERSKLRVAVQIFGRETPVELGFDQVEKFV
jgi:transcriptional antiterminator NusG